MTQIINHTANRRRPSAIATYLDLPAIRSSKADNCRVSRLNARVDFL
jgi:hypothetical protein